MNKMKRMPTTELNAGDIDLDPTRIPAVTIRVADRR